MPPSRCAWRMAMVTSSVTLGAAGDESRLRLVFEKATAESARLPYPLRKGRLYMLHKFGESSVTSGRDQQPPRLQDQKLARLYRRDQSPRLADDSIAGTLV